MLTTLSIIHVFQVALTIAILGYRFHVARVYKRKVKRVQALNGNQWVGKPLFERIREMEGEGFFKPLESLLMIYSVVTFSHIRWINENDQLSLMQVIVALVVITLLAIVQWRLVGLLKKAPEDNFQLKHYMKGAELTFLMQLENGQLPAQRKIEYLLEQKIVFPEQMTPFFLHHDLMLSTMGTRNLLKKEIWRGMELEGEEEKDKLTEAYHEACETLKPVLEGLFLAIDYQEPLPPSDTRRDLIQQKTEELKKLNGKLELTKTELEASISNPVLDDLNRLLAEPEITAELRERVVQTLETIQQKEAEAVSRRNEESIRLDAEATIETARKVYGIKG